MKATKLIIENIGLIEKMEIDINKPLILFYGDIMQGKTTILNAVKYCFGGPYPSDIIRHGASDAKVIFAFEGGSITREWYVGRDGETKSREIKFVINNEIISSPVTEIKRFLNPFLLDQDYFRKMSEKEKKEYLVQLFNVDTSQIDDLIFKCESKAKELRTKVKMYGEIDLTPYEPINVIELQVKLKEIRDAHDANVNLTNKKNAEIRDHNEKISSSVTMVEDLKESVVKLRDELNKIQREIEDKTLLIDKGRTWLEHNKVQTEIPMPQSPDTSVLERRINEAAANDVRVEIYEGNLKKNEQKLIDTQNIKTLEAKEKELKQERIDKLKEIADSSKIKELSFDDDGNIMYQGTYMGMLSTAQTMKMSSELSTLYPEGFGLDLIDRAESLGKSIFSFVARAEEEKKTILATIVGEKPAEVPENIGVFVVEKGEIK